MGAGLAAWKQIVRRLLLLPVQTQCLEEALRQNAVAVFGSLAALDANEHARVVDVADLQLYRFRDPQATAVAGHQNNAKVAARTVFRLEQLGYEVVLTPKACLAQTVKSTEG